jgi:predicted LPLAT superfamily acyltransferase
MQDIIALGKLDAILAIHHKLEEGALVGILADRAAGRDEYVRQPFLGAPARFPTGPFRMAAMLRRPVYFMAGLQRGGNRYEVHFELLEDFTQPLPGPREAVVQALLERYVAALERHCRSAPFNWFNFYDFWEGAAADGASRAEARIIE